MLANCCTVVLQHHSEGVSQVLQQMPAIRNLYGIWCTITNRLGVRLGAIAGHNLDAWVIAQPLCEPLRRSVRQ